MCGDMTSGRAPTRSASTWATSVERPSSAESSAFYTRSGASGTCCAPRDELRRASEAAEPVAQLPQAPTCVRVPRLRLRLRVPLPVEVDAGHAVEIRVADQAQGRAQPVLE